MRRSVAKAAVAVLCAALALPVSPASADSSTAILINNVLHSISVLQPTQPTDPSRVIGIAVGLSGPIPPARAPTSPANTTPPAPCYHKSWTAEPSNPPLGEPHPASAAPS